MTALPELHCLADAPAGGDFGVGTGSISLPRCRRCNRPIRPADYTIIEVVFDEWDGEDLLIVRGFYLVSARLRAAFERAKITGATYEDAIVSAGPDFEVGPRAYADDIPVFYRWHIDNRVEGPARWWKPSGTCATCGESAWEMSPELLLATQTDRWEKVPPRAVYSDAWPGVDVFLLKDPGPPMITGRTLEVLQALEVPDVTIRRGDWVDR